MYLKQYLKSESFLEQYTICCDSTLQFISAVDIHEIKALNIEETVVFRILAAELLRNAIATASLGVSLLPLGVRNHFFFWIWTPNIFIARRRVLTACPHLQT